MSVPDSGSSQVLLQPGGRSVQGGWSTSASPEPNDPPSSLIGWRSAASPDEVWKVKRLALIFTNTVCQLQVHNCFFMTNVVSRCVSVHSAVITECNTHTHYSVFPDWPCCFRPIKKGIRLKALNSAHTYNTHTLSFSLSHTHTPTVKTFNNESVCVLLWLRPQVCDSVLTGRPYICLY